MSEAELYPEPLPQGDYTLVAESEAGTSAAFLNVHHPDVLLCLANLSNDEVFTPPNVVNAMLDLLPESLWHDPTATFLDPCCKSGVFLREIAKRLIAGLAESIPDLQTRLDHIFTRQLFGLGITDLTALLSRRSVYCSKTANGRYSLTRFPSAEGNIRLPHSCHTWKDGRCVQCGASQAKYDRPGREAHAYAFIHGLNPEELFKMKFDVIIGNPPYQLTDSSESASASPIYQKFVLAAKKLNPAHIVMVTPSRWFSGGKGLSDFRDEMLKDCRLHTIVDYFDSSECFPGVDISGGISYFHWDREYTGDCRFVSCNKDRRNELNRPLLFSWTPVFIRFNEALSIVEKIRAKGEPSFMEWVSERRPFGLETKEVGHSAKREGDVRFYINRNVTQEARYIARSAVPERQEWIDKWKVLISYAYGERGDFPYQVIGRPFLAEPGSSCSETFLVIGVYETHKDAEHVMQYLQTRFLRFLVLLQKATQHATAKVYSLVPQQDFSEVWTDEKLYRKYGLTAEEIAFIERMIKPMEV